MKNLLSRKISYIAILFVFSTIQISGHIEIQSFEVNVVGEGKPIILIHGFNSSPKTWDKTIDELKDNYECHILDLAGFTGSDPIKTDHYLSKVAEDIKFYIEQKKLDKPAIIGHSMGGLISLMLTSKSTELVGPQIIVDSLPFLAAAQNPTATVESVKGMAENMKNGNVKSNRRTIPNKCTTVFRNYGLQ